MAAAPNQPPWLEDFCKSRGLPRTPLRVNPGMIAGATLWLAGSHVEGLYRDLGKAWQMPVGKNAELTIEAVRAYWCFFLGRVFEVYGQDETLMRLFNTGIRNHIFQSAPPFKESLSDDIMEEAATLYLVPSQEVLTAKLIDWIAEKDLQGENLWVFRFLALNARFAQILGFQKNTPPWVFLYLMNGIDFEFLPGILDHLEPSFSVD